MGLYERILGVDATNPKIPVHAFQALAAQWAKGKITSQQAQAGVTKISGAPLTAGEVTEVNALVASVPTGTSSAQQAARALRMAEIDQILLLADAQIAPYDTPAGIRAGLGL
jgi:hypothetical protein